MGFDDKLRLRPTRFAQALPQSLINDFLESFTRLPRELRQALRDFVLQG